MVHHLWVRIEIMDAALKPKPILRPDHAGGLNLEIRGDVPAQIEWMPEPTDPKWRQCVRCLCWSVARHRNGLRRKETSRLRSSPRGVSIVGFLQFIFLAWRIPVHIAANEVVERGFPPRGVIDQVKVQPAVKLKPSHFVRLLHRTLVLFELELVSAWN